MSSILVIGAGSWGTALSILLAHNGHEVWLFSKDAKAAQDMTDAQENSAYLPGISFPNTLKVTSALFPLANQTDYILYAAPSHALKEVLNQLKEKLNKNISLILASKGIDPETGLFAHDLVKQISPSAEFAVLSGPSFAKEVAQGLPTAVTIASLNSEYSAALVALFSSSYFRPYSSNDIIGVEVGGIVKNVIAIAVGMSDGLGYGANARAALITRGSAEVVRLGMKLGGQLETFLGLSGMGDLVLTCTDNQSRNRRFGLAMGRGSTIEQALKSVGQVVEGYRNVEHVFHLAQKFQVEMPITQQIYQIIYHQLAPQTAVINLLARDTKSEF